MTKLYFINPGVLDIRALVTQGVSAKPGDHPIGKFGTGAKYAIAGVLRLGRSVMITCGTTHYAFHAKEVEIRGKPFGLVCMEIVYQDITIPDRTVELGFTTALGQHWEPWMLYRELRANALDEGGWVQDFAPYDMTFTGDVHTIIEVDCEEIAQAHENLAEHWLTPPPCSEPLWASPLLEVWPGRTSALFYRGMKCGEWPVECAYTYNFLGGIDLTEDRTCSSMYTAKLLLGRELMKWSSTNVEPIEHMLRNDIYTTCYERSELDWDWSNDGTASREFLAVVACLRKAGKLRDDKSWVKIGRLYTSVREEFMPVASPTTPAEQAYIAQCLAACETLGLPFAGDVKVSQDWEEGDWEEHEIIDGVLYISHYMMQHEPSWLVEKLVQITLQRDASLTYKERDRWAFEQLLIAKGLGDMLPLPASVQADEVGF
jgi:hypothetical protein